MFPVMLFVIIGIRMGYTDFWYWFFVVCYAIVVLVKSAINASK